MLERGVERGGGAEGGGCYAGEGLGGGGILCYAGEGRGGEVLCYARGTLPTLNSSWVCQNMY